MIRFTDSAPIGRIERTAEGYIATVARAVRVGVQDYGAWESEQWTRLARDVGKGPRDIIRVYRPPESVFSKDSLATATHIPVTIEHPPEMVDADNWEKYAVGETSTDALRDGEMVAFSIMVKGRRGTDAIDSGKVQLSAGYRAEMNIAPKGSGYDYIMGPPEYNHLAIVDEARAGSEARIGDSANWGASPVTVEDNSMTVELKTVILGDKAVQVEAKDADTVSAILRDHAAVVADKDKEIGELTIKLADAESKILSDEAVAEKVAAKVKADTERAAVKAKIGDKADKMTDAQIEGAYLALGDAVNVDDSARKVLADPKVIADADAAILAAQRKFLGLEGK